MNEAFLQTAIELLKKEIPDLKGVYLFGSHAEGTATPESDIDIAFLSGRNPPGERELFVLKLRLARTLNTDVDLIDLQNTTTVLQFQIVMKGIRFFCNDIYFCDEFDLFVMKSYQDLNLEREEIIQDIKKRGFVYA